MGSHFNVQMMYSAYSSVLEGVWATAVETMNLEYFKLAELSRH